MMPWPPRRRRRVNQRNGRTATLRDCVVPLTSSAWERSWTDSILQSEEMKASMKVSLDATAVLLEHEIRFVRR